MTVRRPWLMCFLAILAGGTARAAELGQTVYVAPFGSAAADVGAYATETTRSFLVGAGLALASEGGADFVVTGEVVRVFTEPPVRLFLRGTAAAFVHLRVTGREGDGDLLFQREASASGYDVSFPWARGTGARQTAVDKCVKAVSAGISPGAAVEPPEAIAYALSRAGGRKVLVVQFEGKAADCAGLATATAQSRLGAAGFEVVQDPKEANLVLSGEILGLFTEPPVRLGTRTLAIGFAHIRCSVRDAEGKLLLVTSTSNTGYDVSFREAKGKQARKTAIEKCMSEIMVSISAAATE